MRIHTKLTRYEMHNALKASGAPIWFESLATHASRTHDRAFEVILAGSGGKPAGYARNGNDDYQAATWDEWGAFFGALYDLDPEARCGGSVKTPTYRDAEHYHYMTGWRFRPRRVLASAESTYLPADTHKRHHWEYKGADGFQCTKCSASRPHPAQAYAPRAYS